jgi:uncharacterized SAM-binding protein YcdF (DUF218 family)
VTAAPGTRRTRRTRRSRRRTIRRWALAVAALLLAGWLVGGYFVVVHPVTNRLARADAIVVLGAPDIDGRVGYAFTLAQQGYAPVVAISVESEQQREAKSACRNEVPGLTVLCFQASPATTQGEARQIRSYAAQYGWKRVIVITSSYHVSRARMIVQRCFGGRLMVVSPAVHHSLKRIAYEYVYQTAGYVKAFLVTRGC